MALGGEHGINPRGVLCKEQVAIILPSKKGSQQGFCSAKLGVPAGTRLVELESQEEIGSALGEPSPVLQPSTL